jgi:hypothetical protein
VENRETGSSYEEGSNQGEIADKSTSGKTIQLSLAAMIAKLGMFPIPVLHPFTQNI